MALFPSMSGRHHNTSLQMMLYASREISICLILKISKENYSSCEIAFLFVYYARLRHVYIVHVIDVVLLTWLKYSRWQKDRIITQLVTQEI